jgi:hypothetical protein
MLAESGGMRRLSRAAVMAIGQDAETLEGPGTSRQGPLRFRRSCGGADVPSREDPAEDPDFRALLRESTALVMRQVPKSHS